MNVFSSPVDLGRFWKKQLCVAKDARRVDVLCYRIYLSFRLLDGTSRFKELHEIIKEAKAKLEMEVGPVNGVSSKMARGIVSRLSIASDVQSLCSIAIEKGDECLATKTSKLPNSSGTISYFTLQGGIILGQIHAKSTLFVILSRCHFLPEGSLPAACKFLFEEVTSSSVVIVLIEVSAASSDDVKGYKLWYCMAREDTYTNEPVCVFPRTQRRILISNLQPCTEYSFRIVSYTEASDVGHSEAKCFTKSVEIIHRKSNIVAGHKRQVNQDTGGSSGSKEGYYTGKDIEFDSGFKVRDLGKILRLAWAQQQGCLEGFSGPASTKCCESCTVKPEPVQEERKPSTSRQLDLNVASVPDLNEELTPSSRDEDNCCTLELTVEADDDATSHDNERNGLARSHGSGDSQNWNQGKNGDVSAGDSQMEGCRKRGASNNGETHDSDSTLINGSPIQIRTGGLDENFEYCVKIIRWLECQGLIEKEFRLKLLTWFSLRSTEQERRVVNTFIQTLIDDPSSLAGQLVDTFSEIVSSKRPRNGFCCKLWH